MAEENIDRRQLGEGSTGPERGSRGPVWPLVVAAIVIAGLYFGQPVLEPMALAVLLSLMLVPVVRWLGHWIGRVAAVLVSVLVASVLMLGVIAAITEQAIGLIENLPRYEENIAAKIRSLGGGQSMLDRANQVFQDLLGQLSDTAGHDAPLTASGTPGEAAPPVPVVIRQRPPGPLDILKAVVGPMLFPIVHAGLVVFLAVLILLQREDLRDRVLRLAGAHDLHRTTAAMNEATERISRYLLMQLGAGLCFGIPFGIGLAAIGIPNAPLWGMLGVVFRFIPYIGGPMTAVFPITLAIAVDPGWGLLLMDRPALRGDRADRRERRRDADLQPQHRAVRGCGRRGGAVLDLAVGHHRAAAGDADHRVPGRARALYPAIAVSRHPARQPSGPVAAGEPLPAAAGSQSRGSDRTGRGIRSRDSRSRRFSTTVAVPALVMAQADTDRGALTPHQRAVIAEGFAAVARQPGRGRNCRATRRRVRRATPRRRDRRRGGPDSVIAARNELDLAAAWLLEHLLRTRGHRAAVYAPDALSSFAVDELPLRGVSVICLSLLSTNSAAQLRYLVRRLRRRARHARIVIGYWDQRDDADFSVADATPPPPPIGSSPACPTRWPRSRRRWPMERDGTGENIPDGSGLKTLIGP